MTRVGVALAGGEGELHRVRGRQGRVEVAPQDHPHGQPGIGNLDLARDGPLERLALAGIDVFEAPGHASDLRLRRLRIGGVLLVEDGPLDDANLLTGERESRPAPAEPALLRPAR